MVLVKGRILPKVLKDIELLCTVDFKLWTIHQECQVPVLKVCYCRYCSWFAEIDPAFKLSTGNLVRRCLVGLCINPLNAELNLICYLLALLGAHHFLHVSRIRIKPLTLRLLMSYIYIYMYIYIYIWSTYS